MAVALSGLPCIQQFDALGEPATLAQRWLRWEAEFELFVAASGVTLPGQKRALLLHLAGSGIRDIFLTYDEETRGNATDYDKILLCLNNHFKLKRNVPMARQTFLSTSPQQNETINNFITRLKTVVEDCEYGDEKDNQVRDRVISYIHDRSLKSKLYREDNLTLTKLIEVVSSCHDKEALVLVPKPDEVNFACRNKNTYTTQNSDTHKQNLCWRCNGQGHFAKQCERSKGHICERCGIKGHFKVCCRTKQDQRVGRDTTQRGRGKQHVRKNVRTVTNDSPQGGATSETPREVSSLSALETDQKH